MRLICCACGREATHSLALEKVETVGSRGSHKAELWTVQAQKYFCTACALEAYRKAVEGTDER